jgi:hypothetical protein
MEAAAQHPGAGDELEGYRWLLWLLDIKVGEAPSVKAVDGSRVDPARVLKELHARGAIWYTAAGASADGAFPVEQHGFMLRGDRAAVLLDVLEARLVRPALRQLGGDAITGTLAPPSDIAAAPVELSDVRPALEPAIEPARVEADADAGDERSWLRGALTSISALWSADDQPQPERPVEPEHPLARRINYKLVAIDLPPHDIVIEAGGKRAIDYSKRKSRIVVNADHPAVRAVLVEPPPALALAALLAAIASEINRAHKAITGADELHALLELMSERPS